MAGVVEIVKSVLHFLNAEPGGGIVQKSRTDLIMQIVNIMHERYKISARVFHDKAKTLICGGQNPVLAKFD